MSYFVSYKREDRLFVDTLLDRMEAQGILGWTDANIKPGEEWKPRIDLALKETSGVIVVVTPTSLASQYVTYEWSHAMGLDKEKPVIPILLIEPDPLNPAHPEIHPK